MGMSMSITFDTAFPFLSIYLKEIITDMFGDTCRVMFIKALSLIVEKGQELLSPIRDGNTPGRVPQLTDDTFGNI